MAERTAESLKGILHPATHGKKVALSRYSPSETLAALIERYWVVGGELRARGTPARAAPCYTCSLSMSNQTDSTPDESGADHASRPEEDFPHAWVGGMLEVADRSLDEQAKVRLLKGCAAAHYRSARMAETVAPFAGNLDRFLAHLSDSWNWKIGYDPSSGVILADENKSSCVCPLARGGARLSPLLCHCSEGFAERMFSAVTGKTAHATVVRSVLRGDASCVYRIELGEKTNGQARRDRAEEGRREPEARGA